MRISAILAFLIIFTASACKSPQKNPETAAVKDISLGPVVHDSLTADQILKIKYIQQTFQDVYPVTLEETITNFKRDEPPDKEIAIWLNMATAYQKFIQKYTGSDSAKKQEAFKLILLRSMMPSPKAIEQAQLKVLSQEQVNDLLQYYHADAVPLTTKEQ